MAPLLRNLKRKKVESEKTTTPTGQKAGVRATNKASAAEKRPSTMGAKNKGREKRTSTTAGARKKGTEETETETAWTPKLLPPDLRDLRGGEYVEVPIDRNAWIEFALIDRESMRQECEEAFQKLKHVLEINGFSSGDEPYKDAMKKLLGGEAMSREVRGEIGMYIQEKLREIKRFIVNLMTVEDWDDTIASYVIGCIKEVTEHIGVEFTELNDIVCKAQAILDEPDRGFKIAKGEYLKCYIRSWIHNTPGFRRIQKEWVDNPTARFTCFDLANFDDRYVRRYETPSSSYSARPL